MDAEKQKCWSCLYYKAFYLRGSRQYYKQDRGYCDRHKKIVDEQEHCEKWYNGMLSKYIRKRAISEQLTEMTHKLTAIEQALKGDINVNEL